MYTMNSRIPQSFITITLLILFIDDINTLNSLEYLKVIPLSTVGHSYIFVKIKWESTPFALVDDVTIQPPPLCGPTNITNSSVMACLEGNGNIVYNISIQQRSCSQTVTTPFSLDCPLLMNIPLKKFVVYTNGTITALSNDSEITSCINGVWPSTTTMCKNIL